MSLIQQQSKLQSEFSKVIEFTQKEISKRKSTFTFQNVESLNELIAKDVIINYPTHKSLKDDGFSEFHRFLLSGPIMTDEQFNYVQEKRKHFNEWK